MKLYKLLHGKSKKKKLHVIMIDSLNKCQNYKTAREKSGVDGVHDILPADAGASTWRQKSATIGGNSCQVPKINRNGKTSRNGWIGKNGFQEHT